MRLYKMLERSQFQESFLESVKKLMTLKLLTGHCKKQIRNRSETSVINGAQQLGALKYKFR